MKNISAAMVKAQRDFGPALKSHTNPAFRSKYADLSACVEAVIDALNKNGIALMQHSHECGDGVLVETVFVHESGEILSAGKLHVPATKKDAQGYGSALTYARRYSLMAACGIAPEDDDGNAASKKPPEKATPRGPVLPAKQGIGEDTLTDAEKDRLYDLAAVCNDLVAEGRVAEADKRIKAEKLEIDQEIFLANNMNDAARAAVKAYRVQQRKQASPVLA